MTIKCEVLCYVFYSFFENMDNMVGLNVVQTILVNAMKGSLLEVTE